MQLLDKVFVSPHFGRFSIRHGFGLQFGSPLFPSFFYLLAVVLCGSAGEIASRRIDNQQSTIDNLN